MYKHFREKLDKLKKTNIFDIFLITAVAFVSVSKTLKLYFWHDDFSIVYIGRTGDCVFSWPYASYCTIFSFLEKFFKYSASTYFAFAFILFIFSIFSFRYFVGHFYSRKTTLFLSLIYTTGYIGAGVFLEIYDSITTFLSLGLLFLSLGIQISFLKNRKKFSLVSLFFYAASVLILQARSLTYIFPLLAVIVFYSPKQIRKKLFFLCLATHISICLLAYFASLPIDVTGASWARSMLELNPILEIKEFFQTLSYMVIVENFKIFLLLKLSDPAIMAIRFLIGLSIFIVFIWFINKKLFSESQRKVGLLALVWVIFIYLPFGIRSDLAIWTTHRYLVYTFPGFLLAWGLFGKYKLWYWATLLFVIFYIYRVNVFLKPYVLNSEQRKDFYFQYNKLTKEIPEKTVIFFDYPREFSSRIADFLRVGFLPSEASLATEKAVKYDNFNVFVESRDLSAYILDHSIASENIFTYYYDGKTLFDTTQQSRRLLKNKGNWVNLISRANIVSAKIVQKQDGGWCGGNNASVSLNVDNNEMVVSSQLRLDLVATVPHIFLPYNHHCQNGIKTQPAWRFLNYLNDSREIMNKINQIETAKSEDNLFINNIIDDDPDSFWTPGRRGWVNKERPVIHIEFKSLVKISGIVVRSDSNGSFPTDFEVTKKGQILGHSRTRFADDKLKIQLDKEILTDTIDLKILRTAKGEWPLINEISFIPTGYKDIFFEQLDQFQKYPTTNIETSSDLAALTKYLSNGAPACIEWSSENYGKGVENFRLMVDGKIHTYDIQLPTMGIGPVNLKIGCLDYPVKFNLSSVKLGY